MPDLGNSVSGLSQPVAGNGAGPALEPPRILVVDDDPRNLFAIEKVLEDLGEVVTAASGDEALKYMLRSDFAVVLLDVFMPGLSGYDTAALIRGRERSRHTPIIFLTAVNRDVGDISRGYAMGAVDYVLKPVDPLILKSKVAVFAELFAKTQEIRRKAQHERSLLEENLRVRTEKLHAEEALRRAQEQQAVIIQSLPLVLYAGEVGGMRGAPRFVSGNAVAICGFAPEQFLASPDLWSSRVHPDDQCRVLDEFARLPESGALAIEYRWCCADGQHRFFLDQAVLVRDETGRPKEIFGTFLDVSERKRLEQQLLQSHKMEALGRMTGGVAHDFNNMLTLVLGNLDRLRRLVDPASKEAKRVEMALHGAQRCAELTKQMLAFARRQLLRPAAVNVNEVVAKTSRMVRRVAGETIEMEVAVAPELWPALADPAQVEAALVNLIMNARDAMPKGGKLTIRTENVKVRPGDRLSEAGLRAGEYVSIAVIDTGVGIAPENLDRVFEPFFTTKESGQGTGLGLSIIYGFVKQSGGHIEVESERGRGSTFRLILPRAQGIAVEHVDLSAGAAEPPRGRDGETILLVEDNEQVRHFAAATLNELGYTVLQAGSGDQALALLQEKTRVDLLFSDVVLGNGMSGFELAAAANSRLPGLRVLFTSAYHDLATAENGRANMLQKPYWEHELAAAVRGALGPP
jgi:signal transduction histidine kinase/DNA-binding response OmpR family regulator